VPDEAHLLGKPKSDKQAEGAAEVAQRDMPKIRPGPR
jgi:hypothetical protein